MRSKNGFTLIELSIVLVIIGLIVGGVLVGRDMIRAAELRAVYKDYEHISAAVNTFRTKYNCMPGDCLNAEIFFGSMTTMQAGPPCPTPLTDGATSGSPDQIVNDTPGIPTCNGDGDGKIDATKTTYEMHTIWQHLANAQVIGGMYSGGGASGSYVTGVHLPPVKGLSDAFVWVAMDGDTNVFYNLAVGFGNVALTPKTVETVMLITSFIGDSPHPFSPADAFTFDTKFDDGNPVKGRIQQPRTTSAVHCTDAADETAQDASNASAQYLSNSTTYKNIPACDTMIITGW